MKMPAFQFYPADWRKDPGVQALDRHDRSVWFDMLCIMHESDERGVLLLAGRPIPEDALARMLNLDNQTFNQTLNNLLTYGVASRREQDGALYSRRMVRDQAKREEQAEYGKKGGNPALCENYNVPGFLYVVQRASDGWVKIGISSDPSRRLYKLRYQRKGDSLELLASLRVDDMGKREAELHHQFKHRASGEWFALNEQELDTLISTLKGKSKADVRPSSSSSFSSSTSINTPPTPGVREEKNEVAAPKKNEGPVLVKDQHTEDPVASAAHTKAAAPALDLRPEFRPDPDWAPAMRLVAEQMIAYWGLSEYQQQQRMAITRFCRTIFETGHGNYLREQFTAYRAFKDLTCERKHDWNSFIGKEAEAYQNPEAGWNKTNWADALTQAANNPKYASAQHRLGNGPAASAGRATTLDRESYTGRRPAATSAAA
ncbi:GIY-YIG nuclease family protein [Hymenobacter sp. YC55]|uniref:GIY-YIG nuclease family protein n=1 Tax=Hymenobacter sp. YC55 TaxID=3034019 RepID=UPI0023F9E54B|nr:GIY-YIG nuclease family protein [Hymenobacter sp. YC55]MDF7810731.1 GIY-YIG nuclease family protein [Hymenobacter sp. YC55]